MNAPDDPTDEVLASLPLHLGFRVLPPCVITGTLGHGAMGSVFRGRHYNLDVDVAIKLLRWELAANREYVVRFQREARIAASIKQENLVGVFDTLEAHGRFYTVMEFVDGETVENRVHRKGPLPVDEALFITLCVAKGLSALHARKVCHRDVKPANIIISGEGQVKLADLGIAHDGEQFDTLHTQANALIGTPQYMAAEQFENANKVTDKVDIYALAMTLAFMLQGDHAMSGASLPEVIRRVCEHPVPALSHFCGSASAELSALFAQMTARDPAERPDAKTLIAQLSRIVYAFDTDVDLADPGASHTYGKAGPPTELNRERVGEIRKLITSMYTTRTVIGESLSGDIPATVVGNNPGATPATVVYGGRAEPARGSDALQASVRDQRPATSRPAPEPARGGGLFGWVVALLVVAAAAGGGLWHFRERVWPAQATATPPTTSVSTSTPLLTTTSAATPHTTDYARPIQATTTTTKPDVTVAKAPTVSAIAPLTVVAGDSSEAVPFEVRDDTASPFNLTVTATSADANLIQNNQINVTGGGPSRVLKFKAQPGVSGPTSIVLRVTNAAGVSSETAVAVSVVATPKPPPRLAAIASQQMAYTQTTKTLTLTVAAEAADLPSLRFAFTSDNPVLLPAGSIVMSAAPDPASRTLTLTPAPGRQGVANVGVTVTDSTGRAVSSSFQLTVDDNGVAAALAAARDAGSGRTPKWPVMFEQLAEAQLRGRQAKIPVSLARESAPLLQAFRSAVPAAADRPTAAGPQYLSRLESFAEDGRSNVAALLAVEGLLTYRNPVSPELNYVRNTDPETDRHVDDFSSAMSLCALAVKGDDPQYDACAYAADVRFQHHPTDDMRSQANFTDANRWLALGCDHHNAMTEARAAHYMINIVKYPVLNVTDKKERIAKADALALMAAKAGSPLGAFVHGYVLIKLNAPGTLAVANQYVAMAARAGHPDALRICEQKNIPLDTPAP